MRIHSSSIATLPAKRNAYKSNQAQQAIQKINKNNQPADKQLETQLPKSPVNRSNETTDLNKYTIELNKVQDTPIDAFTSRALKAYAQENDQLIKNQYSNSVSGVDFFA